MVSEYAKADPEDLLVRISIQNHGLEPVALHLLPTIWFRNTWSWGCVGEGCHSKPDIRLHNNSLEISHETLGEYYLWFGPDPEGKLPPVLFTENETNTQRLCGIPNSPAYVKDGFHLYVIEGRVGTVNPKMSGTKAAPYYLLRLAPGEKQQSPILSTLIRRRQRRSGRWEMPIPNAVDTYCQITFFTLNVLETMTKSINGF